MGERSGGNPTELCLGFFVAVSCLAGLFDVFALDSLSVDFFFGLIVSSSSSIAGCRGESSGGTICLEEVSGFRGNECSLVPLTVALGEDARSLSFVRLPGVDWAAVLASRLLSFVALCSLPCGVSGRKGLRKASGVLLSLGLIFFIGLATSSDSIGRFLFSEEGGASLVTGFGGSELLYLE